MHKRLEQRQMVATRSFCAPRGRLLVLRRRQSAKFWLQIEGFIFKIPLQMFALTAIHGWKSRDCFPCESPEYDLCPGEVGFEFLLNVLFEISRDQVNEERL